MTKQELKALRRPFVRELFRKNKFNLVMTVAAAFLAAVSELVISWTIKGISDLISGDSAISFRTLLLVAIAGFALMGLAWVLDTLFLSEFRARAMRQYRKYAFDRLLEKGIHAFSGENSARYLSALSNDANTIEQDYVRMLQNTIQVGIAFVGALGLMLWYSPLLTLIAIGFSLLPIVVSIVLGDRAAKAEKQVSDRKERYTGMLKDVLSGFAVVKSFKAEKSIDRLHDVQFGVFFVAAALALSGRGGITAGTAIVFVQLLNYVLAPIQVFPTFYAGKKSAYGLIDKLAQALSQNIPDEGEAIPPELTKGIELRDLSFAYEADKPVLRDVDMELKAGGCYALVGGSGSGKSTILNLLMAASKEYSGEILYDGAELRGISASSLYDLVSIIQQNVFVFNSTIRNNITMFSDFPEAEIDRAVRLSGLKKLMDEKGADYLCGENGSGLSGGERQRGRGHRRPGRRDLLRGAGRHFEAGRLHPGHRHPRSGREHPQTLHGPLRPEERRRLRTGHLRGAHGPKGLLLLPVHRVPAVTPKNTYPPASPWQGDIYICWLFFFGPFFFSPEKKKGQKRGL